MISAYIAHTDYYLPEKVLTNEDLAKEFPDWPPNRIMDKTGISIRHVAGDDEHTSALGVKAASKILDKNKDLIVDYIIVCTQSPDYLLPTTACLVQKELKLPSHCGAIDINQGCSGYVYSLGVAKGLIETGQANGIIIINADTYTKYIASNDKTVKTLFGDAAAATYIGKMQSEVPLIRNFVYGTDGSGAGNLICKNSGLRKSKENERGYIYMNGPEIFNFTLDEVPKVCEKICKLENCKINDFDYVIFHQANKFMLDALRRKIGIDEKKFPILMSDTGNTVSATIPIVIRKLNGMNIIKTGNRLLLIGFGVGYSWAACVVEWR
jgi:3-oxoacyl-[acyl-carrier-protein] synthase-3